MKLVIPSWLCLTILILALPRVTASPNSTPSQTGGWSLTTDRPWYNIGDIVTFLVTKPDTRSSGMCVMEVGYSITVILPDGRQNSFDLNGLPDPAGTYYETAGQAGPPPGTRIGQLWEQPKACVTPEPSPTLLASTNYLVQESGSCQYGGSYPDCNPPPSCQYGGSYPNCNAAPSCQYGGTYPNCYAPPSCPNGGNYPYCNPVITTVTQQQPISYVIEQPQTSPDYALPLLILILIGLVFALAKSRSKPPVQQLQQPSMGPAQVSICRNCGALIRPDSGFCTRCGRPKGS